MDNGQLNNRILVGLVSLLLGFGGLSVSVISALVIQRFERLESVVDQEPLPRTGERIRAIEASRQELIERQRGVENDMRVLNAYVNTLLTRIEETERRVRDDD